MWMLNHIQGDAKADIIWVHPIDGSAVVFINNDYTKGKAGWSRQVPYPKDVAPGRGFSGANIHFARIHINHGRADYVAVAPASYVLFGAFLSPRALVPGLGNDNTDFEMSIEEPLMSGRTHATMLYPAFPRMLATQMAAQIACAALF